tara:strand:+ start:935 stop:1420 length:486 start_codon:yes stop_codon:yes gene_type:complete
MTDVFNVAGTVQYLNPPPEGKKQATIKLSDGTVIGCWPNELGQFAVGQQISVLVKPREYQGRTYYNLTKGHNGNGHNGNGHNGMGHNQPPAQPPAQQPAAPAARPAADTDRTRSILLQTIIKASASHSGSTEEADQWLAWYEARISGEAALGAELNDEIPF